MMRSSLTQAMRPLAGPRTSVLPRSIRQFGSTPAYGFKAIFSETDNSELNEVLKTIQEKIVFPAYLPKLQRAKIFSPKSRAHIQQNPIVIELDGLEHKFSFIDRFKEIPNSKKVLQTALKLMKTKEDWDNLGTLLAGYEKANIKLAPFHYSQIIRHASRNEQIYSVVECVKQAKETGFTLNNTVHVIAVLNVFSSMITESNAEDARIQDASKWTDIVLDLLERPLHINKNEAKLDQAQFHPFVRGQVLFIKASVAQDLKQREQPAEKELSAVSDSAQALLSLWTQGVKKGESLQVPASIVGMTAHRNTNSRGRSELSLSELTQTVALNIKGMKMARELLGDAANGFKPMEKLLDEHLERGVELNPKNGQRYADIYAKILGKTPSWPCLVEQAAKPTPEV
ncbi:hypothetical protein EDB81DRAFT_752903 [Dactylonectria macrodidyma]|uniref:Uncharacterized protein n=1 Tax=Dactylonectria macrodidyma TaxID=307937 RepID=A0A9P9JL15_9HYPO|nr:hypothetical protein EDB81DRAFT_752903 [Dactylonectria macrodidyma]